MKGSRVWEGVSHLEDNILILLARLVVDFGGELWGLGVSTHAAILVGQRLDQVDHRPSSS